MQRRAIMTLLSGVVALAISLSACATHRQLMDIEARVQSDEKVFIGVTSGGKIDMVHPPVKEACRPARADCGEQIRWHLLGPIGDGKIHVSEKAGGNLGCFRPFDLHKNHRQSAPAIANGSARRSRRAPDGRLPSPAGGPSRSSPPR